MSFWSSLTKGIKNIGKTVVRSFSSTSGLATGGLGTSYLDKLGDTISSGVSSVWDSYTGADVARENLKAQQAQWDKQNELNERQFAYQQQLNKEQQWREDNAYLRKVQDLKNAGLNPVLAAGGSGASSAALSAPSLKTAPAPQLENTSGALREVANQVFSLLSMKKDFAVKDAEISMMRANKEKADAEAAGIRKDNEYKDAMYQAKIENIQLENRLKSGTLQSDIRYAANRVSLQDRELLIKDMEYVLSKDQHALNGIDLKIKDLVSKGNITENQILEKKLELLSVEFLQKALDLSNAEWDTQWYHDNFSVPRGFDAGWIGNFGMLLGGVGEAVRRRVVDFFSNIFGGSDSSSPPPKGDSKPSRPFKYSYFEWKDVLKKATEYPSSSSFVFKSLMRAQSDYGVRRNH